MRTQDIRRVSICEQLPPSSAYAYHNLLVLTTERAGDAQRRCLLVESADGQVARRTLTSANNAQIPRGGVAGSTPASSPSSWRVTMLAQLVILAVMAVLVALIPVPWPDK